MTARAFLNVKMNCIALTGGQAHLTMMSAEMTQHHTCPLLDAAWLEVIRNSAHDSICACSVDAVCDAVLHRFGEATEIADGLIPVGRHRRHQDLQVLAGVAEGLLLPQGRGFVERLSG